MTQTQTLFVLAALVGCAPPPIPTGQNDTASGAPSVRILFPVSATASEQVYCSTLVIVVDVDNYELIRGEEGFPDDDVEGQGHWHLKINDTYVQASAEEWIEWTFIESGDHKISAELATNTHEEIDIDDSVEIAISNEDGCIGAMPIEGDDTGGGVR